MVWRGLSVGEVVGRFSCVLRFSTSRSDVTSTEIRIRKLEYNLSKLLAYRVKTKAEGDEREVAKKKQAAEDAAFFQSIADTNDGMIKIQAARAARKPLRGDPRAKEFSDDVSDDEDVALAPKMLSEEGGGGFMEQLDADFDGEKVLEVLARGTPAVVAARHCDAFL